MKSVLQINKKIVSCHTADSKPIKQEVSSTVILPPLVFLGLSLSLSHTLSVFLHLTVFLSDYLFFSFCHKLNILCLSHLSHSINVLLVHFLFLLLFLFLSIRQSVSVSLTHKHTHSQTNILSFCISLTLSVILHQTFSLYHTHTHTQYLSFSISLTL